MSNALIDDKTYNRAKSFSTQEEIPSEEKKKIYRNGHRKGFQKGLVDGFKKGIIVGAILTILATGTLVLTTNGIVNFIGKNTATNVSVDYGYEAVISNTHRASKPGDYWYDYHDIAMEFDAETMDFDSFVYGAYRKIGWNEDSTIMCMNRLFYELNLYGYTDYGSFVSYCESKGACKEVDGRLVVDTSKYKDVVTSYLRALSDSVDTQAELEEFRHGK